VLEWAQANKITINHKKLFTLIIPPKIINLIPNSEIFFQNNSFSVKESVQYMGITIDARLNKL